MTRTISLRAGIGAIAIVACLAAPTAAHAWWRVGFGFVPPPVYYAPPPPYYSAYPPYPAAPAAAPNAEPACYAGAYVCPLERSTPVGGPCSCPTNGNGRIGGRVG